MASSYLVEFDGFPVPLRLPVLHGEVLHCLRIKQRVKALCSLVILLQVHLSPEKQKALKQVFGQKYLNFVLHSVIMIVPVR